MELPEYKISEHEVSKKLIQIQGIFNITKKLNHTKSNKGNIGVIMPHSIRKRKLYFQFSFALYILVI